MRWFIIRYAGAVAPRKEQIVSLLKRLYCRVFHYYYRELLEPMNYDRKWYIKCHACNDWFLESMESDTIPLGFN